VIGVRKVLAEHGIGFANEYSLEEARRLKDLYDVYGTRCGEGQYGDVCVSSDFEEVVRKSVTQTFVLLKKEALSFSASAMNYGRPMAVVEISKSPSPREITRLGRPDAIILFVDGEAHVVEGEPVKVAERIASALEELRRKTGAKEVHADGWIQGEKVFVYDVDL